MPDAVLSSNQIRKISLPNKSDFGAIEPISSPNDINTLFGEGLYAQSQFTNEGCSDIPEDGSYHRNVLGVFPDGSQAWYYGHAELDSNTLDYPIADAGDAMMNVNLSWLEEYYFEGRPIEPFCPIPFRSFVNSKYSTIFVRLLYCRDVITKEIHNPLLLN